MTLADAKRRTLKGKFRRAGPTPRITVDDLTPERWFKKPPNVEVGHARG